MLNVIFILLSLFQLAFLVGIVRLYGRNRSLYTLMAAAVIAGLFYDNLMVGIGRIIGEGALLEGMSAYRFYLHALLTPLLMLFGLDAARRFGIGWSQRQSVFIVILLLTLAMIGLGISADIIDLGLVVAEEGGTLRYVNGNSHGPPIPAIMTIIVLIVFGAAIWRKGKWSVLCIGAIIMFICAGAGASILVMSNIGEVFLAGAVVWTEFKMERLVPKTTSA